MANLDAAAGFQVCNHAGSAYNPPEMRVAFAAGDATAAFKGSLVKLTGAVDTDGVTPVVTLASPSDTKLVGAITRFDPQRAGNWTQFYRTANTRQYAYVPRDPQCFYMVQEDSVGGNIAVSTAIGQNINFTAESGSTVTGMSTMQLDSSTPAADTAALPIRLIGPVYRADNDPTSASSNGAWIVKINQNDLDNTTGTA
jgi:hypothetical protein